jgi:rhamnogalacturonyl hydrolase YesR
VRKALLFIVLGAATLCSSRALGTLSASVAVQTPPPLESDLNAVAALPGEPRVVSAAGVTRDETPLLTIENPAAFDPSETKLRLVIVGGLHGDERSARAVVDAVRWFKTEAPPAIRQRWSVSALPMADPDRHAVNLTFAFPPDKGFFDDPQQPESRYLWRWIVYQAPDLILVVHEGDGSRDTLAAALSNGDAAGLGTVPAEMAGAAAVRATLQRALGAPRARSPLHVALAKRVERDPLPIARVLAKRYPQAPIMSYIPSVAWTNMLRLAAITGEDEWRAKVREQTNAWISAEKAPLGDQKLLTSIAGYMIFGELAALDGTARSRALLLEGASLAAEQQANGTYANGRGWTDDMFMATAVLVRAGGDRFTDLAARQLIAYAARLQRADGVFIHAVDGPIAWGRGNGFAAFGLMEALTAMPESNPSRSRLLDIYRRQMQGVKANQAPDGSWREIIDLAGAYREETATAMLMSAMARGIRLGWIDTSYEPVVQRAWRALSAHIVEDGTLVDVCSGTGAGPTRRYYYDRPAIDGPDDRGGAMALLGAIEVYELAHGRR